MFGRRNNSFTCVYKSKTTIRISKCQEISCHVRRWYYNEGPVCFFLGVTNRTGPRKREIQRAQKKSDLELKVNTAYTKLTSQICTWSKSVYSICLVCICVIMWWVFFRLKSDDDALLSSANSQYSNNKPSEFQWGGNEMTIAAVLLIFQNGLKKDQMYNRSKNLRWESQIYNLVKNLLAWTGWPTVNIVLWKSKPIKMPVSVILVCLKISCSVFFHTDFNFTSSKNCAVVVL